MVCWSVKESVNKKQEMERGTRLWASQRGPRLMNQGRRGRVRGQRLVTREEILYHWESGTVISTVSQIFNSVRSEIYLI